MSLQSRALPRALALVAALALMVLGLTQVQAASSSATLTATIVDNDKILVIGHGFPASTEVSVSVKAGSDETPLTATSESDGRFGAITFLPTNYNGAVSVTASGGGASATATANANGTGAPVGASPNPTPSTTPPSTAPPATTPPASTPPASTGGDSATAAPTGPVIYVATNGDDGNDGKSATSAKKTIGGGLAAASPGDTILVGDGQYDGNLITAVGGSAGKFITIRAQHKHGATIFGNGDDSDQSAVVINYPYLRIQDMKITGKQGVRDGVLVKADNVELIGNEIFNICRFLTDGTGWKGGAGVDMGKSDVSNLLFDGNYIHDVGAPGSTQQLVHGMYLSAHVTNGRVTNNVITRVEDFGLHPYDETEASGWQFINNTIFNTGRGILQAPGGVTRNNIVFNTRGAWYEIRGDGNVVDHNLVGGTGERGEGDEAGFIQGDPMFNNVDKDDVSLKAGSPAIDKGSTDGAPATDFNGKKRPQGAGIDMGAFES